MRLASKPQLNPQSLRVFDILLCPVVTEKSTIGQGNNQYTFKVAVDATKSDVKTAVEKLYKVKVESVNTLNVKGKTKRFRGRLGKRDDVKKAVVRLAQGQTIDLNAGL